MERNNKQGASKARSFSYVLFTLGLFFFPFNDFEGLSFLGEYSNELGTYFFLLGFFSLFFGRYTVIPYKDRLFLLILLFICWCFICTVLNYNTVSTNYFKMTGGIERFIRQYLSLLIAAFIFPVLFINAIWRMSNKDLLIKIRKIFLYSFILVGSYGLLEAAISIFHISAFKILYEAFDIFPMFNAHYHDNRISSVAFEPPFFAIYLITISGWMFSYILTHKSIYRFVPGVMVLLITFFCGSRTALITITIQAGIFVVILYQMPGYKRLIINSIRYGAALVFIVLMLNSKTLIEAFKERIDSLDFKNNLTENVSNKSRFGMQVAALRVFAENPIVGVGYGQQSYHARHEYPLWATKDNYEFELYYKNHLEPSFPPAFNLYTRYLAETGIIGFILIISWFIYAIRKSLRILKTKQLFANTVIATILLTSFVGFMLNWMQVDSLRMYGFWLSVAILIKITQNPIYPNEQDSSSYSAL
jgi:O-antigen ligase